MSELTDLEISKRVAEIEGFEFDIKNGKVLPVDPSNIITDKLTDVYNPLADKALCFDLMVKYNFDLTSPYRDDDWTVEFWSDGEGDAVAVQDENLQRAICLAIIAMHEGK